MTEDRQIAAAQGVGTSTPEHLSGVLSRDLRPSRLRTLYVGGTFAGANVAFELSLDDVTYFPVVGADAITAASAINLEFRANYCRINVTGGAPVIDAWLA